MKNLISKGIAVIGEGETEWYYFESLRVACRYPFRIAPGLPQHSDILHIVKLIESKLKEDYDYVFVVVDMDRLLEDERENRLYKEAKAKYSKGEYVKRVLFFETNPCTEFWFLLHFLPNIVRREYSNSGQLIQELRKYIPNYERTNQYLARANLYEFLMGNGNIERAKENSEKICEMTSKGTTEDRMAYSQIHRLLQKLDEILENSK